MSWIGWTVITWLGFNFIMAAYAVIYILWNERRRRDD